MTLMLMIFALTARVEAADSWPLGIIGQAEKVGLIEQALILPARIDTGAETSSLDAREIELFERDGKDWVRFQVPSSTKEGAEMLAVEAPVKRSIKIKRHGVDPAERPVVELMIVLGETVLEREFSLTDRSNYEYPILIGRNVLEGQAAVDVARKNTLKTSLPKSAAGK